MMAMDIGVNYYRLLGVDPASEGVVIQTAYRALMRRYHPDTNHSPEAISRAQSLSAAYAVLNDPYLRAVYDRARSEADTSAQTKKSPFACAWPSPRSSSPTSVTNTLYSTIVIGQASRPPVAGRIKGFGALLFAISAALIVTAETSKSDRASARVTAAASLSTTENALVQDADYTPTHPTDGYEGENILIRSGPPVPLSNLPHLAVQYRDIVSGVQHFMATFEQRGMAGARHYSTRCHAGVVQNPSWSGADQCAAFDYAAAHIDRNLHAHLRKAPNSYFEVQSQYQLNNYVAAGADTYAIGPRLASIGDVAHTEAMAALQKASSQSLQRLRRAPGAIDRTAFQPAL